MHRQLFLVTTHGRREALPDGQPLAHFAAAARHPHDWVVLHVITHGLRATPSTLRPLGFAFLPVAIF